MGRRMSRTVRRSAVALALLAALSQAGPVAYAAPADGAMGELDVRFDGVRSSRGLLRACLTRDPAYFLKCDKDPASFKVSIAATKGARLAIGDVPPGDYALMVLHDENSNARVDTMLGIPREGVGFSRNPKLYFGPPSFAAARIHVPAGISEANVTMRYFL